VIALALHPVAAHAQDGGSASRASAHRRIGAIVIDGRLDEPAWRDCAFERGFVQRFPDPGAPPVHDTKFCVAFDDDAIYVAVRAADDQPDLIRGLLTRRDNMSPSDWITIGVDSYHDRRTAFVFGINPADVQRDLIVYDDQQIDDSWDAVWRARTTIDAGGWTAEFRIPLSQLRFSAEDLQSWGLQVERSVARSDEHDVWSPSPPSSQRVVSRYGTLDGVTGLTPARRVELLPYITGGGAFEELGDTPDPFVRGARARYGGGLDLKVGFGSAFTLSATINPDFSQIEADPSQISLSAVEPLFSEKRPFFLDGVDLFQFSLGQAGRSTATMFYSRRIGAAPHGDVSSYLYSDAPKSTTIYGAVKLSGKTSSGWSVGLLDAVTGQEIARVQDGSGAQSRPIVEPVSNHAIARVWKDLRDGHTSVGGELTAVARQLDDPGLAATLHDQAYTGGLQLQHRFGADDQFESDVRLIGSWVHGAPAAIRRTETNLIHLYQRPDQGYLHLDPRARSLAGSAILGELGRFQGPGWRYGTGFDMKSPGLEINDIGFQRQSDYLMYWALLEYHDDVPGDWLLAWSASGNATLVTDYQPLVEKLEAAASAAATLHNHWVLGGGLDVKGERWNPGALRGGPALREDTSYILSAQITSDTRKTISGDLNLGASWKPTSSSWSTTMTAGATARVRSNIELFLGPSIQLAADDSQYVRQLPDLGGTTRYVFGRINDVVTSLTLRANWTFSPHLSLQIYAMPFIATGHYSKFKEAADTHARDYAARFHVFGDAYELVGGDTVMADRDGDGAFDYSFTRPDFTLRQLNSNAVLRWEYRPGSAVFLIWSRSSAGSDIGDGSYRFVTDLSELTRQPGQDVVMAKLNLWLGG
jgi:hypothetical protein